MDPQEGDIADLPDGRTATFRGGRWVVQGGQPQAQSGPAGIPGFVPFQSPADRRAEGTAARAESREERLARNEVRAVENDERSQSRSANNDERALLGQFQGLPVVREFPVVREQYQIIRRMGGEASSPAGDLALVTAYMKMLDPGSVVREQEFANAANAGGAMERARAAISDMTGNGILTPKQRADFVRQAGGIYEVRATGFNEVTTQYRTLAESYGFNPDSIGTPVDLSDIAQPQPQPDQQGGTEQIVGRTQQYEGTPYYPPLPRNPDGSVTYADLTPAQQTQLQRGDVVNLPNGQTVTLRGQPIVDENQRGSDQQVGENLYTREPNLLDSVGAFSMAAAEQIPGLDEAAVGAAGAITGRGYSDVREQQRGMTASLNQTNRGERIAGGLAGAGMTMAAPGGNVMGRFLANAPKGAAVARGMMVGGGTGAVYGAGAADGGLRERLEGARDGAMVGAMTGGALAGGGRRIGEMANRVPETGTRAAQVQTLRDNGVSLTPGQRIGGLIGTIENLAQRAPILGTAIRGARERGVESLNRAVGNRALDNIGEGVPANVPVGGEMVSHVRDRLGSEFDRAYSMVPEINPNDPDLIAGMTRIGQRKADLPPAMQQQFDNIVSERLARLQGGASGQNVGAVRSELNTLAGGYLRSQDPAQQALGNMIAELGDELDGAISRASPEAGQILGQAREGYADYIRLERASTAAGGRPFSPGQLETAVRASDGSVRRGAVGRGDARMQDLSSAARNIMPDQFGNPGTADAAGLGGLGVGLVAAPITTTAIAGGLTAAATPYFAMARNVVDRLPAGASQRQVQDAIGELDQLAAKDSNVIVLRDEIARRLGAVSGVAGGNAPQATERLMTGGRSTATSPR